MHFKDDPISDIHAKKYLIILSLKHFPGPTKFGPVFWSRLFQRGPVEYNYPSKISEWTRLYLARTNGKLSEPDYTPQNAASDQDLHYLILIIYVWYSVGPGQMPCCCCV